MNEEYIYMNEWMIEWLTDWLNDWLTDWLNEWMTDWLTDWLIDRPNKQMNKMKDSEQRNKPMAQSDRQTIIFIPEMCVRVVAHDLVV